MEENIGMTKIMSLKNKDTVTYLFAIEWFSFFLLLCGLAKMEKWWYLLNLGIFIYSLTIVFRTMCCLEDLYSESSNKEFEDLTSNTKDYEKNEEIKTIEAPKEVVDTVVEESKMLEKDDDQDGRDWELIDHVRVA